MISQVNSAALAYTPLIKAVKVVSVPDENFQPSQSARLLNDSKSMTDNSLSSRLSLQLSSATTAAESAHSVDSADDTVQKNTEVQQVIDQLKARDYEVKAHEMAHLSAAGGYSIGGMSFTYQVGPDGRQYAVGGEVGIDVSAVAGDPEATLQKAMVVYAAALAPAEPSQQDYKVASAATQMMAKARADIMAHSQAERKIELAEKDPVSETGSESRALAAGSILERPFNSANRDDITLQYEQLIENVNRSHPIDNPDRNQFDIRVLFSLNSLLSMIR